MTNTSPLIKDLDYIINEDGNLVFTAYYLLKRGHCCMSGCVNCPYGFGDKVDPNLPGELNDSWNTPADYEEDHEDESDD
jgi:hypothetical protein